MTKINLCNEPSNIVIPKCITKESNIKSTFVDRNRNPIIKIPYDPVVDELNKLDINELRKEMIGGK